jgi:hypothetical protein
MQVSECTGHFAPKGKSLQHLLDKKKGVLKEQVAERDIKNSYCHYSKWLSGIGLFSVRVTPHVRETIPPPP